MFRSKSKGFFGLFLIFFIPTLLGVQAHRFSSPTELVMDSDQNGLTESFRLEDQKVTVREEQTLIWQSPESWQVQQILLADADNDGQWELLILLWKPGSFGKNRPFWHKEDDLSLSCHLFMYRLVSGKMRPVWCSSALDRPVLFLQANESSVSGKTELAVYEDCSSGILSFFSQALKLNPRILIWQDWGFTLQN